MLLNLNDSTSIVNWWKVWPARHDEHLNSLRATRPQFGVAIRAAQRQIARSAELQALLAKSLQEQREQQKRDAEREGSRSSIELRWQELAMAA
jgi:transketolase